LGYCRAMWREDFVRCLEESTTANPRVAEAIGIKEQHLPERIYKYRCDTDRSRNGLKTDTVWMASPESYNDPYDSSLVLPLATFRDLLEGALARKLERAGRAVSTQAIRDRAGEPLQQIAEATVSGFARFRKFAKVCSFSGNNDALLMWSHYANHHKGFCIEYNIATLGGGEFFRKNLYPVFYSKEFYDLRPFMEGLTGQSRDDFRPMIPLLAMLHKFDGWGYEDEWRLVDQKEAVEDDYGRSAPVPSRIFLGARFDLSAGSELLAICQSKGIPVSQMRLADDRFVLSSHELPAKPHSPDDLRSTL
jgi:hypothetical protein